MVCRVLGRGVSGVGWVGAAGRTWESESATSISEITARRPLWQSQRAIKHGFKKHSSRNSAEWRQTCSRRGSAAWRATQHWQRVAATTAALPSAQPGLFRVCHTSMQIMAKTRRGEREMLSSPTMFSQTLVSSMMACATRGCNVTRNKIFGRYIMISLYATVSQH